MTVREREKNLHDVAAERLHGNRGKDLPSRCLPHIHENVEGSNRCLKWKCFWPPTECHIIQPFLSSSIDSTMYLHSSSFVTFSSNVPNVVCSQSTAYINPSKQSAESSADCPFCRELESLSQFDVEAKRPTACRHRLYPLLRSNDPIPLCFTHVEIVHESWWFACRKE